MIVRGRVKRVIQRHPPNERDARGESGAPGRGWLSSDWGVGESVRGNAAEGHDAEENAAEGMVHERPAVATLALTLSEDQIWFVLPVDNNLPEVSEEDHQGEQDQKDPSVWGVI